MKLVSILIVHYKGFEVLHNLLKSVEKLDYESFEVVLVDNGSIDHLAEKKLKYSFKLKIITSKINLGFAGGNNLGVKNSKGEYILLLNNDTLVAKNLLISLAGYLDSHPKVSVVQPKIALMADPRYLDNCGAFLNKIGLTVHWGYGERDNASFNKETEIFSAKGACFMTRRRTINKIGLFESKYGSYFEETDFCWRVWLNGESVVYYPDSTILHKVGYTSSKFNQHEVTTVSTRNRFYSFLKNFSIKYLAVVGLPCITFYFILMCYYLFSLKISKSLMIAKAFYWIIIHLPSALNDRKRVQSMRKINDSELEKIMFKPINIQQMFSHFQKVEANFK